MGQVEEVAIWVGLIAGIAGIVLSIVAMWFTVVVDRRSRETSNQTIQSMQKIESYVERISTDIGGLIRAAWERMLGTVGAPESVSTEDATKSIAAGLAAELRAELLQPVEQEQNGSDQQQGTDEAPIVLGNGELERLNNAVRRLERRLEYQLRSGQQIDPRDDVIMSLRRLSPLARALIREIATNRGHLNRREYMRLRDYRDMRNAVTELRSAGLLVPLISNDDDDEGPVYWIAGPKLPIVGAGLLMASPDPSVVRARVNDVLREIGYLPRIEEARRQREAREGNFDVSDS